MPHPWFPEKPMMTASAFSIAPFLSRWADGRGGEWLNYCERFIERKKRQGIQALRVFDETTFWADRDNNPANDHRFFNLDRATSTGMWNYGHIARPPETGSDIRPERLTVHHQVMLLELIRLAYQHAMQIELVVDATLKHSPGVGWEVIGHCIRQVADFCKNVERGKWFEWDHQEGGGMGSKHGPVNDRVRAQFDRVADRKDPPLRELVAIEIHNEFDAHSRGSWKDSWPELDGDELKAKATNEVNKQLIRMRVESHWPGAAVWVSQGGNDGHGSDLFSYDHTRADAIAFHPARHEHPDANFRVGDRFAHIIREAKRLDTAAYANEITHGVGDSWWWTIEEGVFRRRSSTRAHARRRKFIGDMMDKGIHVCDHTLENMACAIWFDELGVPHEMPLTEFELILLEEQGGVEPPPPQRLRRYAGLIQRDMVDYVGHELADENELDYRNERFRLHYEESDPSGWSQQDHQQVLIQSDEFKTKNPEE